MKETQFKKGMIIAWRRKIAPRDWFFESKKWHEVDYGCFVWYVNRNKKEINRIRKDFIYWKKEEKKQLRRDGFIGDYFEYLFD